VNFSHLLRQWSRADSLSLIVARIAAGLRVSSVTSSSSFLQHNFCCWIRTNLCSYTASQVESCVMTDSQSASLSWNKAPIWGLRPDFYYCQTVAGFLMWGALSDERTGLPYNFCWPSPSQSFSGPNPVGLATNYILLSQIRDFSFRRHVRLAYTAVTTGRTE
jgi:hypothetical protein